MEVISRMINDAISLAELGYRVFPCQVGTKTPATMHGCLDATNDLEQIEKWWSMWPEANIAVSTDGLLLVDIDPLEDGSQNPWLQDAKRMMDLMRGATSLTPRGGRHFWFRQPTGAGMRSTASRIAPGIDTRADGGYVVVPPSQIGERSYEWAPAYELTCPPNELPLPPDWLLSDLQDSRSKRNGHSQNGNSGDVQNEISEGGRNDTLTRMAGKMRRAGFSQLEITAAIRAANHSRCRPPLEDDEVDKIAWSVSRYEPDQTEQAALEGWYDEDAKEAKSGKEPKDPGNLSEAFCEVPGFIGDVIRWNLETAHRPQPILALAGALSLMAVLTGRKITDRTGTRTNLYCLGVAHSGHGKEHARKVNKEILHLANMEHRIGPEGVASHAGIVCAVNDQPEILFQIDEIGRFLKTVQNPAASPHLYQIVTVLLKLFTSSSSLYVGDAYADSKKIKRIEQPHACLYGTTVPESLFESLTEESLKDGFIGRLLVFEAPVKPAAELDDEDDPRPEFKPPQSILECAAWWRDYIPTNLLGTHNPRPRTLDESDGARQQFRELKRLAGIHKPGSPEEAIWTRAYEKARKLALLYATSENRDATEISEDAAGWACQVVRHLSERMEYLASRWLAQGIFGQASLKVFRLIEDSGESGMTLTEIHRATQSMRSKDRAEILESLSLSGRIHHIKEDAKDTKKKRNRYVADKFYKC